MKMNPLCVLFAVITVSMAVGCGSEEAPVPDTGAPASSEPDAAPADPAPAATAGVVQDYAAPGAMSPGGHCSLDAINGVPIADATVEIGREVSFGGWVVDSTNHVPAEPLLVFEGERASYAIPFVAGVARPDVAAALGNGAAGTAGFNINGDLRGIATGEYSLAVVPGAQSTSRCDLNTKVEVVD